MCRIALRAASAVLCVLALLTVSSRCAAASAGEAGRLLLDADAAFDRGDFEHAITSAGSAEKLLAGTDNRLQLMAALKVLGISYLRAGHLRAAADHLEHALGIADNAGSAQDRTEIAARLGGVYLSLGMLDQADKVIHQALTSSREQERLRPLVFVISGTMYALGRDYTLAKASYKQAIVLGRKYGDAGTTSDALVNLGRTLILAKEPGDLLALLAEAYAITKDTRDTHDKAMQLVSIGRLAFSAPAGAQGREMKILSEDSLMDALSVAEKLGDQRALSYSCGYLGEIFERKSLFNEALGYTRRAALAAGQVRQGEALYLWQWQTGRILRELKRPVEAAAAYRLAVQTLGTIRDEISSGCAACGPDFFSEKVEPVYFGLADLLLELAGEAATAAASESYLVEARQTVEAMKGAELHDYFKDPCVEAYIAKTQSLEKISGNSAVLYVIPFEKRLEILLGLSTGIKRFTVGVGREQFAAEVRAFRRTLEKRTTREYMPHAQNLYAWLIKPLYETLVSANIETIVFVPDKWLRTVPPAALHDGSKFLISRFSVASTQGLSLTDPKPLKQQGTEVLMAGITEPVQGYPGLENVSFELQQIGSLYSGKLLKDSDFVTAGFKKELSEMPFSIVHIASHGEFTGDPQSSFILAWDDKLSMDQLEAFIKSGRYRTMPVELLALSACQTASGDDRAALGLAGVAVKAGARSALATLWSVSDEASFQLISEFYRQFSRNSVSKARALQQAQSSLLENPRFQHPYYWAAFILIGNWL